MARLAEVTRKRCQARKSPCDRVRETVCYRLQRDEKNSEVVDDEYFD